MSEFIDNKRLAGENSVLLNSFLSTLTSFDRNIGANPNAITAASVENKSNLIDMPDYLEDTYKLSRLDRFSHGIPYPIDMIKSQIKNIHNTAVMAKSFGQEAATETQTFLNVLISTFSDNSIDCEDFTDALTFLEMASETFKTMPGMEQKYITKLEKQKAKIHNLL